MYELAVTAPAKLNLFLGVGALRPDGYHEVTTVMHALDLADTVHVRSADELAVSCDVDLGISAEHNLAFRAAREFSAAYGIEVLVDIEIEKHIPHGAGRGGGSSDAAGVLAALAHWAGLPLDHAPLVAVARSLGADCAFMLRQAPALMGGRGDEFVRALPPIAADVVLVMPACSVATADAYRTFDTTPQPTGSVGAVADALRDGNLSALAGSLANNLSPAAYALVPEIAVVGEWLAERTGVLGVLMAGSGSATFALCEDADTAGRAATAARERGWWSVTTQTRARGVAVEERAPAGEVVS